MKYTKKPDTDLKSENKLVISIIFKEKNLLVNKEKQSIKEVKAPTKVTNQLKLSLKNATVEKGVENAYWRAIADTFKTDQPSDQEFTDGFIDIKYIDAELFMLMEFKYDKDLNKRSNCVRVLIQLLFYMHKIREDKARIPNMVMVGDKNHAFVMNTKYLQKYLNGEDIDWSISPSSAAKKYATSLVVDLDNDPNINFYVHDLNDAFTFNDLVKDIILLVSDTQEKIKLTDNNINVAFDQFSNNIVLNKEKYSAEELVGLFITVVTDRDKVYSNNTNKIQINKTDVLVNKTAYKSFIEHFETKYRPSEKRKFTSISDRLIQDLERRSKGEFYTPSAFVNYALKELTDVLGNNWRNEFVVWDPAWGTGNLTRDSNFANLFASTINHSDLDQGADYNRGAHKFVFDFLNDDIDFEIDNLFNHDTDKLDQKLADILVEHPNQKLLIFMNPPYGTAGNANSKSAKTKKSISNTLIKEEMKQKKLKVQEQLYAQFLYRIIRIKDKLNLENLYIGLFSPSLFMTGPKYDKFRDLFLKNFKFVEGNLFKASHFADVKSNWAIDFSIWEGINQKDRTFYEDFEHNLLDLDSIGNVKRSGKIKLWNTDRSDTKSLQTYLNENTDEKSDLTREVIQFTSRYANKHKKVEIPQNAIAYLVNDTNNIEASGKGVYLMSSPITRHIKTSIITNNTFKEQMLVLAVRKTTKVTWYNQKNEFLAPNKESDTYNDLLRKSIIYSIFSPANNVISYRQDYEELGCSHLNPWSFVSCDEIKDLADEYNNEVIYNDAIANADQSYVYQFLNSTHLNSNESKLMEQAIKITRNSFKFRKIASEDNPQYSLDVWDASWNQVLKTAIDYIPDEVDKFKDLYTRLENEIAKLTIQNNILKG